MKTKIFIIVIAFISACTNEKVKVERIDSSSDVTTLPLQIIKENSIERKNYFNLDSIDLTKLAVIDSAFYTRYFLDLPISNLKGEKLEFEPDSRYYFFDYKDSGDLALFSFIHDDEVGYDNLYHFTYDKAKNQLLRVDYLAATGSDGGQSNVDKLKFNQSGDSLNHTSLSSDQKYIKNCDASVTQYDSVVYNVLFSKSGTKFIKFDSLVRMDTVWRKN